MGELGVLIPIKAWLSDPVCDPDLKGPVAKARAEWRGYSEDEVREIWKRLDAVLRGNKPSKHHSPPILRR